MEQIIYTYPEFQQVEKKVKHAHEILLKVVDSFTSIYPDIDFNIECDVDSNETEHLKKGLPDELNGLPINKDEMVKQVQRRDLSEVKAFFDSFNTFIALNGVDALNSFIKRNNTYFINAEYLSKLKRSYSLYATNPEQKHMIASYIHLKDAINKFNSNALKFGCSIFGANIPTSHFFEVDSNKLNVKPAIFYEIIKTIK